MNAKYNENTGELIIHQFQTYRNSPFLGSITISVLNNEGEELRRDFLSYFDTIIEANLISDLPSGTSEFAPLKLGGDIKSIYLVQMPPATSEIFLAKN